MVICREKDCKKRASFGKLGTRVKEFCKAHSPSDYVNVAHKTCEEDGCVTIPNYGKPNSKKAEYCKTHSPSNYVDVISKTCQEPNCTTRPTYGVPGYSPEYCSRHRKKDLLKNPHKYKDGYILCVICFNKVHYTESYCSGCKYFVNNGVTRNHKRKEDIIYSLLEDNKVEFIHNLQVKGGCSKRRPDFIICKKWGSIVLEIDENQHNRKNYPCECEITRMKQIYFDEGVNNLLFIRYNPDKYKNIPGQKIYKPLERHTYLIKYLKELEEYTHNLGVVYLFYDGFINPPEIEVIDPYE